MALCDPTVAPLDLQVIMTDLQLDQRLRDRTPAEYDELWDVFKPSGRVDATVHVVRDRAGGPVELNATVDCRDVAAVYRHFPYPLDHLTGRLTLEKNMLTVNLQTLKGGQPLRTGRHDQETRRRCRGRARHHGRVDRDRRHPQKCDAPQGPQGRRSVQSQRRGQGPCPCLSRTTARPP